MKKLTTRQLVESALMVAVATVLSLLKIDLPFGGGVTLASMLPIILISHRYGFKWGLFTAFVYSVLQLILGVDNVGYATSAFMAAGVVVLDYILAYTVLGLSGLFGSDESGESGDFMGLLSGLFSDTADGGERSVEGGDQQMTDEDWNALFNELYSLFNQE